MANRQLLRWWLLPIVLLLQAIVWQVAIVQLAYIHSSMQYRTAADLLDNNPLVFYAVLFLALALSNGVLFGWFRFTRGIKQPVL